MYCSDVERAGRVVAGDQFLLTDAGIAGFLDGRRHLGLVEASPVTAWALLTGVASDDLSLYGAEEWALLDKVRTSPDVPLDLPDPFCGFALPVVQSAFSARITTPGANPARR